MKRKIRVGNSLFAGKKRNIDIIAYYFDCSLSIYILVPDGKNASLLGASEVFCKMYIQIEIQMCRIKKKTK